VSLNHCSIPRCAEGRSEEPPMQTRALGSRVAWQNQVPVLDDSQTLVSRDGQGGSENWEAWGTGWHSMPGAVLKGRCKHGRRSGCGSR
jgi:hypothetical protein